MSQWEQMTKTQLINELEARGIWLERLGAIVDGSRDAVLIGDEDSRFMLVNSAACELTGYSEEELLGMRFQDLLEKSALPAFGKHDRRIMEEGQTIIASTNIVRKDGTKVPTEFSGGRFVIDGTPYKHAIARDITQRKRMEEELRFMSSITSQISDAVIATDLDFKIVFVNESFKKLYGYSEAEVLGRTPDFLNAESVKTELQQDIYETVSTGREWRGVAMNLRKDGSTFPCELIAVPLLDEAGQVSGYAGTQRDVSARKRAEEERAATIDRLRLRKPRSP
jgi:PAS domain S-box-containing protein